MANLNSVMLIGRLTRDPQVRSIPSGVTVCSFGLATNERFKRPNGEEGELTCFVEVEAWRRLGEICAEYLSKGREVFVAGRLRFNSWEAKDGGRRSKITVEARQIQFLGAQRRGDNGDGAAEAPRPGEPVAEEPEVENEVGF